jgi:hypothetical protein
VRLELVAGEGGLRRLQVPAAETELVDVHAERHVAHERDDGGVGTGQLLVGGQVLPQLWCLLVEMGEDPVEVAVGGEQFGCRFLADPGHTRQVVRRVSAQRGEQHVLRRRDTGALDDARLVVQRVVADPPPVVEHADMGVLDELEAVAVPRHHDDIAGAVAGLGGQGRQDVVRLEARCADDGDGQRLHDLADHLELVRQVLGRLGPAPLVVLDHLVAERGAGQVEGDGQ